MKPREIAADLAAVLSDYLAGSCTDEKLVVRLRTLATQVEGGSPKLTARQQHPGELEIFEYWKRACDKPRAIYTDDRRAKVRARLRQGFSVEQIKRAIDGVANSPWHRGENNQHREFLDLTLICQTGSKVEQYAELGGEPAALPVGEDNPQGQLFALRRQSQEQLNQGDTAGYQATQKEIKRVKERLG